MRYLEVECSGQARVSAQGSKPKTASICRSTSTTKKNMKKLNFPATFAYVLGLVLLGGTTLYFGIAWKLSLVPLETEWGDFATWLGAIGTIAGFAAATVTFWHSDKVRRDAEDTDRVALARRVGITSTMEVKPAHAPWKAHLDAWKGERGAANIPSVEEQLYQDAYRGPWVGKVTYTAQNGTPYPLFTPVVTVDSSKLPMPQSSPASRRIRLPALIPGSTTTGSFSVDLSDSDGEDMIPDLVELEFTDVWKVRWRTTSQGCEKIETPDEIAKSRT